MKNQRDGNRRRWALVGAAMVWLLATHCSAQAAATSASDREDVVTAVSAAAAKDCGCGHCAAKGCEPCHGKNCYFCVAKGLMTKECGCHMCSAKGCTMCGPGCDVCKFHLAPVEAAKTAAVTSKP